MNREEALDFLGLKEPVNKEAVLDRCNERYNYYQMLYANAPNEVIENIQLQNLDKLNLVKQFLLEDIAVRKKAHESRFSNFLPQPTGPIPLKSTEKLVVAWLIVHTENRRTETFDLYEGVNFVGRKKRSDSSYCIVIDDDPFMSRTHAFIKCKAVGNYYEFDLYDGDGSKPSVNGVFINGNERKVNQQCSLRENDTIQIGTTKFMFKVNKENTTVSNEVSEVLKTGFIRTIDIKRSRGRF